MNASEEIGKGRAAYIPDFFAFLFLRTNQMDTIHVGTKTTRVMISAAKRRLCGWHRQIN